MNKHLQFQNLIATNETTLSDGAVCVQAISWTPARKLCHHFHSIRYCARTLVDGELGARRHGAGRVLQRDAVIAGVRGGGRRDLQRRAALALLERSDHHLREPGTRDS